MGTCRSAWVLRLLEQSATEQSRKRGCSRVGGPNGAADGHVDTRVLVRTDKWYDSEEAWPILSFVTRAYAGAVDRDLSLGTMNAEISTDLSIVQLGGVQLSVVLIMLCTRRALDCAVSVMYSWGMKAWRMFLSCVFPVERCKIWCIDARSIGNFAGHERCGGQSGCWMHKNDKRRFECIGRRRDLFKIIQGCFREFWKKQGLRVRVLVLREVTVSIRMSQETEEPRHGTVEGFEEKQRMEQVRERERVQVLSRVRQVWRSKRVRSKQEKPGRSEIGAVLLLARSHKIQVGIDSCTAVIVFVHLRWFETKSCEPSLGLSARKVKGKFRCVPFWFAGLKMAETCEVLVVLVAVLESDINHDVFYPRDNEDTQACAYHEGRGRKLELESNGVFELPVLRPPIALPTVQLLESERPQRDFQDCHRR